MTATRKSFTKREAIEQCIKQKGRCGCGCGQKLIPGKIDEQHSPPFELMKDRPGYDGKPSSLWLRACHRKETKEVDGPRIVKARHQAGGKGSQIATRTKRGGSSIQSRNTLGGDEYQKRKAWAESVKGVGDDKGR